MASFEPQIETVIINPELNRIIALSDIHADIHALIICLRDCARVIRKTSGINPEIIDAETEYLLELNLITHNDEYRDDLGYEWIGENTQIVICGDFLDGKRDNTITYRDSQIPHSNCFNRNCVSHEYDQVEIKIFRFINALNQQAIRSNGRIFKILGNHDIWNLNTQITDYKSRFINDFTLGLPIYYTEEGVNYTRLEYFNAGNPGSRLILQDNAYLLLIINNNIFVHGQLDEKLTLDNYKQLNNEINNPNNNKKNDLDNKTAIWNRIIKSNTTLGRNYNRETPNTGFANRQQISKCTLVRNHLRTFLSSIDIPYNTFRVIVGHCPQILNNPDTINSTFINITPDDTREILDGPIYTGQKNIPENILFGIGMECNKNNLDDFQGKSSTNDYDPRYIYKVDIGSTRGFDSVYPSQTGLDDSARVVMPSVDVYEQSLDWNNNIIRNNIGSRTPQVLEIINDYIRILRSTIKNTRIHQPRHAFEKFIKNPGLRPKNWGEININPEILLQKKYLKYKKKYLELKKIN